MSSHASALSAWSVLELTFQKIDHVHLECLKGKNEKKQNISWKEQNQENPPRGEVKTGRLLVVRKREIASQSQSWTRDPFFFSFYVCY